MALGTPGSKLAVALAAALLVAMGSIWISLVLGAVPVPPGTVGEIVLHRLGLGEPAAEWPHGHEPIVWDVRLPRSLLACLVGSGLAVVGASLQSVTRNPLADPHLLGISSGSALGAVVALLHVGQVLGPFTVPILAFAGALLATAIVLAASRFTASASASGLVLTGVAISFVLMAASNLLIYLGEARAAHTVVFWMLGGLGLAQWQHLAFPALALAFATAFLWVNAGALNALTAGDETAATLGIRVVRLRYLTFAVGALLTGVMVAYSGVIGFVGLMIPHVARMFVGGDNFRVIPVSALLGGIFLLWADVAARTALAPGDIPIGIITGLVGGSFFIWLLRNRSQPRVW